MTAIDTAMPVGIMDPIRDEVMNVVTGSKSATHVQSDLVAGIKDALAIDVVNNTVVANP